MDNPKQIIDHMGDKSSYHLCKFGDRPRFTFNKAMREDIGMPKQGGVGVLVIPLHEYEHLFMGMIVGKQHLNELSESIINDIL